MQELSRLHDIFSRTREAAEALMDLLRPLIDNAPDDHSRLYYHHIYEEEEQRLERLQELIPHLESLIADKGQDLDSRELSRLLSDVNLERFGLHNFREHLELALYEFQDEEQRELLARLREMTHQDYLAVTEIMNALSERFTDGKRVDLTDHDEGHAVHAVDHVEASRRAATPADHQAQEPKAAPFGSRNGLTVGSLRHVPL